MHPSARRKGEGEDNTSASAHSGEERDEARASALGEEQDDIGEEEEDICTSAHLEAKGRRKEEEEEELAAVRPPTRRMPGWLNATKCRREARVGERG